MFFPIILYLRGYNKKWTQNCHLIAICMHKKTGIWREYKPMDDFLKKKCSVFWSLWHFVNLLFSFKSCKMKTYFERLNTFYFSHSRCWCVGLNMQALDILLFVYLMSISFCYQSSWQNIPPAWQVKSGGWFLNSNGEKIFALALLVSYWLLQSYFSFSSLNL